MQEPESDYQTRLKAYHRRQFAGAAFALILFGVVAAIGIHQSGLVEFLKFVGELAGLIVFVLAALTAAKWLGEEPPKE